MTDQPPAFRFVDLFAGLGGFHVALRNLRGKGVFAAEWDSSLNSLYETNFGITPWQDVNELDSDVVIAESVPDHEVLTAGFPCQPFSKSGKQEGFEHTLQGNLFFKVHDILRVKTPSRFILENVPNILKHDDGRTKETIVKMLEDLGYQVAIQRLSPHKFGIPQVRERAYFVGALRSEGGLDGFEWPHETNEVTKIVPSQHPTDPPAREVPANVNYAIEMWGDFLRRSPAEVKLPSFPIWAMEFRASYPYETTTPPREWSSRGARRLDEFTGSFGFALDGLSIAEQKQLIPSHARREGDLEFPTWKQNFIRQNRNFYKENRTWIDPWLDEWRPWETVSSFQKFEWNAQGGERDIDKYVIQVRASGIRVKRPTTAPALIAMTTTQVPILGAKISETQLRRYMTPRECAKLQSLEGIVLPSSDIAAYKALGNAVNAEVVTMIAGPLVAGLTSNKTRLGNAATIGSRKAA